MTGNPDIDPPRMWLGALEFNPPVASRLGLYFAQMTSYELSLNAIFGSLAGIGQQAVTEAIFGRIVSISTRIDIIDSLVDLNLVWRDKKSKASVQALVQSARAINARRNEYAHGTYRINEQTKVVELLTWVTSKGRKSKRYIITSESLDADIKKVQTFIGDWMTLQGIECEPLSWKPTLP